MNASGEFDYANESSIDPELICIICRSPYEDPQCTPCDHTFCAECVDTWLRNNQNKCPICRQTIFSHRLVPANRTVRNMVNRLRVKCRLCGDMTIERTDFQTHLLKTCSKVIIPCLAAKQRCPWSGPRDQLEVHLSSCAFHLLGGILTELQSNIEELQEQILDKNIQIDILEAEVDDLREQLVNREVQDEESRCQRVETIDKRRTSHYYQLQSWIANCDTRSVFCLSQIPLSDDDVAIVVEEAMIKKQCTGLELRADQITEKSICMIAHALPHSTMLTELDLRANGLSDWSVTLLMNVLSNEKTNLKSLNLDENRITSIGAILIANMLEKNDQLTHLRLDTNQIDDQGVEAMAIALKTSNRTLKELYLNGNEWITDGSIAALVQMLEANDSLTRLELFDCSLSENSDIELHRVQGKANFILRTGRSLDMENSYFYSMLWDTVE